MTHLRLWFTSLRLVAIIATLALTSGSALAWQPQLKETPENQDSPGLISDTEYESPQFGVGITWSDAWKVGDPDNPDVQYAIGGNFDGPVASDSSTGDIIFMQDTASETSVLSLGFSPDAGLEPAQIADAMGQTDFLEENLFLSPDAEVLLLDANDHGAALLVRDAAPNDDHVVYFEDLADPNNDEYDFWVGLDMYDPAEYDTILHSMESDITFTDDSEIFGVFSADDALEAINGVAAATPDASPEVAKPSTGDSTPSAYTPAASPETSPTADLINPPSNATPSADATETPSGDVQQVDVSNGEFVSPSHGLTVTWTDSWNAKSDATPFPGYSVPAQGHDGVYLSSAVGPGITAYITLENQQPTFEPVAALESLSSTWYITDVLGLSDTTKVIATKSTSSGIALIYLDSSGEAPTAVILEMRVLNDNTVVYVELRGEPSAISDEILGAAENDIQIEGDDALDLFSEVEILDALS